MEGHAAKTARLLTERTRRARHVAVAAELVCLDTFFIGKLKGVGQVTAGNTGTSPASAGVIPARNAGDAARLLTKVLVPALTQARWKLGRVLTDRGSKFEGEFAQACRDLGVTHLRTKPRHAWTNGFVERLQGRIPQEEGQVVFPPKFFT